MAPVRLRYFLVFGSLGPIVEWLSTCQIDYIGSHISSKVPLWMNSLLRLWLEWEYQPYHCSNNWQGWPDPRDNDKHSRKKWVAAAFTMIITLFYFALPMNLNSNADLLKYSMSKCICILPSICHFVLHVLNFSFILRHIFCNPLTSLMAYCIFL